ncbi:MAG: hypothetical protein LBK42_10315 [Propionibacteriaceae bacterium]|jgi:hypothetical protein|nr:hypothetical protein [Propionibacteriaceae bacterium]
MQHSELGPRLDDGGHSLGVYKEPDMAAQRAMAAREVELADLWIDALTTGETSLSWDGRVYQVTASPEALKSWRALRARLTARTAAE